MTAYRIEVGRRHRVEPRQIVGALANEGGLRRDDFGAIQIRPDFSIVELPADMDPGVLDRLSDTRISGKLIEIRPDRRGGVRRTDRDDRGPRGPRRDRDGGGYDHDDRGGRGYDRDDRGDRGGRGYDRDDRGPRKPRH